MKNGGLNYRMRYKFGKFVMLCYQKSSLKENKKLHNFISCKKRFI